MSERIRVLFVEANEDGTVGGSHRCLVDIVRNLDRSRFEPVVLFYQPNRFADALRAEGFEVVVWDEERRTERGGSLRPGRLRTLVGLAAAIRRRRRFLAERRIDLVHLNNSPLVGHEDWLPAGRSCGVPVISHARGVIGPRYGPIRRRVLAGYSAVVAISRHVEEGVVAQGIPRGRVVRIYDGVDLADLQRRAGDAREEVRRQLGVAPEHALVAMVGHLWSWKGQDILLAAVALLPAAVRDGVRVALAGGTGPSATRFLERLEQLAAAPELAGRVDFLGPRPDAAALMNAADIIVHASRKPEPFGLVVLEAMALGRAVVASRLGGPGEVIVPGSGFVFDPAHPEELTAVLQRLLADPALRESVGQAARERAREFDIAPNVRSIERLYQRVLSRSGPR